MNWIKKIIETCKLRRETKAKAKLMQRFIQTFAAFEQAERSNLLFVDQQSRRVLISDILLQPFVNNDKRWTQFFVNLNSWFIYRAKQEYWNTCRILAENDALKHEREKHPNLTKEEVRLVRTKAALAVKYDEESTPDVDGYEFCICSGILRSDVQAEAVGVWRNGRIEMNLV